MSSSDNDILPGLWRKLPEQAGMILGSEVSLGRKETVEDFDPPPKVYSALLESSSGEHQAWVILDLAVAITAGGVLLMRPEDAIKTRVDSGEFEEDDADAVGEFVNQITAAVNDALKEMDFDEPPHFIFKRGGVSDDLLPTTNVVAVGSTIDVGGIHEGRFWFALPTQLFATEAGVGADDSAGNGVDLSPEELAAIREATADAAAAAVGRTLFVVPIERDRDAWSELLGSAGLDYEFAGSVAAVRRALGTGAFGAIVVDADACPAGGLPVLAIVRDGGGDVPAVVVATAPTRTHLLSCVAAGARSYLAKPLDPAHLVESVEAVRRAT